MIDLNKSQSQVAPVTARVLVTFFFCGRELWIGLGIKGSLRPISLGSRLLILVMAKTYRSSLRGSAEANLTSIHEGAGWIPGLNLWVKDPVLP